LIWVVFTFIRGAVEHWYRHAFLDPANSSYGSVVVVSTGIFVGSLAIVAIMVTLANTMRDRGRGLAPSPRR
jgi:hypothetical protein